MAEPEAVVTDSATPVDGQRVRVRAYELYEKRNGGAGDAESDWYRADAGLRAGPAETTK